MFKAWIYIYIMYIYPLFSPMVYIGLIRYYKSMVYYEYILSLLRSMHLIHILLLLSCDCDFGIHYSFVGNY